MKQKAGDFLYSNLKIQGPHLLTFLYDFQIIFSFVETIQNSGEGLLGYPRFKILYQEKEKYPNGKSQSKE